MRLSKLIFLILFLPALAFGGGDYYLGASGVVSSSCPSGTYLFAYNGDYPASTVTACYNNGAGTKIGVETDPGTNITVSADYVEYNAVNAYLSWAVTGDDLISDQEGTIYFSVFFVDDGDLGTNNLIESHVDDNNFIKVASLGATNQIIGLIEANNVQHTTYFTPGLSVGVWYRVGYAWKVGGAGNNHSISVVTLGSAHSWEEDADALDATAWTPDEFVIGEKAGGNGVEDTVRIKDVLVVPTFKGTDIWQ